MKTRKIRILFALLAVMLCIAAFPLIAYAGGGPECEEPISEQVEETTGGYEPEPLTPEGNMTLIDDIEGEGSGDKQFITVVTKNGNYFYIIIDRGSDGENTVHFLNQVDEADLLALIEDDTAAVPETPATSICSDKCAAGAINTNCPVCKTDMTNCMGKEASAEPEPEPEEGGGGMGGMLIIVFILALGGGGAYYYFKVLKPKQSVRGDGDLDDFDFEDDEDEETEPDMFEDEVEDTQ